MSTQVTCETDHISTRDLTMSSALKVLFLIYFVVI